MMSAEPRKLPVLFVIIVLVLLVLAQSRDVQSQDDQSQDDQSQDDHQSQEYCDKQEDGKCNDEKEEDVDQALLQSLDRWNRHLEEEALRLILVGKTGSGKSATGNTILGKKKFDTSLLSKSVTRKAQLEKSFIGGARIVEVMDCPGLFDTSLGPEQVAMEIFRALGSMAPGPHAFLYVIKIGRYTQEEYDTYQRLKQYFKNVTEHMIVLFTHTDQLTMDGNTVDSFLTDIDDNLKTVLEECGGRYVFFNNREKDRDQVYSLLSAINKLGGTFYRNEFSSMAEKDLQKIIAKAHGESDQEDEGEQERGRRGNTNRHIRYEDRQKLSSGEWDGFVKAVTVVVGFIVGFIRLFF